MAVLWVLLVGLAYILAGLLALLGVLVVVPLEVRVAGAVAEESLEGRVVGRWGWGLIGVRATSAGGAGLYLVGVRIWRFSLSRTPQEREKRRQEKRAKRESKREKRRAEAGERASRAARLGWVKAHRRWLWRVGVRAVSALRLRLRVQGTLGLDDPADTFTLFELLGELGRLPGVELDLQRDYLDESLELDVELSGRVWLLAWVGVGLSMLVKPETWRALRAMP